MVCCQCPFPCWCDFEKCQKHPFLPWHPSAFPVWDPVQVECTPDSCHWCWAWPCCWLRPRKCGKKWQCANSKLKHHVFLYPCGNFLLDEHALGSCSPFSLAPEVVRSPPSWSAAYEWEKVAYCCTHWTLGLLVRQQQLTGRNRKEIHERKVKEWWKDTLRGLCS